MRRVISLRSLCRLFGEAGWPRTRGWIEGGGAALSSQAKDRVRSDSDDSCPARPCVRAKRGTYTVGLLASSLVPMDIGAGSMAQTMAQIYRYQRTWRAQ